jgi:hypothetical protein
MKIVIELHEDDNPGIYDFAKMLSEQYPYSMKCVSVVPDSDVKEDKEEQP